MRGAPQVQFTLGHVDNVKCVYIYRSTSRSVNPVVWWVIYKQRRHIISFFSGLGLETGYWEKDKSYESKSSRSNLSKHMAPLELMNSLFTLRSVSWMKECFILISIKPPCTWCTKSKTAYFITLFTTQIKLDLGAHIVFKPPWFASVAQESSFLANSLQGTYIFKR